VFLFTKKQRLSKKKEYDAVFQKARKIITPDFVIMYKENNTGCARLGLAISKKIVAKSHDRNRIKRLIRESFRQTALPTVDIIFLARQGVEKKDNEAVYAELTTTWPKLVLSSKR
jgi:ribonuclease P protein component